MRLTHYMKIVPVAEGYYFLVNGLNGAIDTIDETGYQICHKWLDRAEIVPEAGEEEAFQYLLARGYLCEEGEDHQRRAALFHELTQELAKHEKECYFTFILTYDCNFCCPYCFEKPVIKRDTDRLHLRLQPDMVRAVYTWMDREGITLRGCHLYGGEPLLPENLETVEEILRQNQHRGFSSIFVTNGYYLADQAEMLAKYQDTVKNLQITLDGPREVHNQRRLARNGEPTFDRIIEGIRSASEAGIPVHIRHNMNFAQEEEEIHRELVAYLRETGLLDRENITFHVSPLFGEESGHFCADQIIREYLAGVTDLAKIPPFIQNFLVDVDPLSSVFYGEQRWKPRVMCCSANFNNHVIDPSGLIYPCNSIVGNEEEVIGYFDGNEMHYNERARLWRNRTIERLKPCRDCWAQFICAGGCGLLVRQQGKELTEPFCDSMELLLKTYLPFLFAKFVQPELGSMKRR